MPHCRAVLEVEDPHAEALARALEPDNLQAPSGVEVACRAEGRRLVCEALVDCSEPRGVLRLRNTLDDLILNLKAALSALEEGG
ncbi:KEOPS complex subunit Pcc1 [Stetteria hydrogenophila]